MTNGSVWAKERSFSAGTGLGGRPAAEERRAGFGGRAAVCRTARDLVGERPFRAALSAQRKGASAPPYSVSTVDCPEISNRLRQRMFLQAIMSSLRTM